MPFWRRSERDDRPPAEVDLDLEFDRTRHRLLSALDELQQQVERVKYREAVRERNERRRRGPQPGPA